MIDLVGQKDSFDGSDRALAAWTVANGHRERSEGNEMRVAAIVAAAAALAVSASQSWAQDAAAGEKVFVKCKVCHVADKDTNKVGPSLFKLSGRTAGTHPGFKYSPAMVAAGEAGLVWDDAKLTEYLKDPRAMVKGTKMAFAGLKDDADIANVIAYIDQFK
jgi:cytochrome c